MNNHISTDGSVGPVTMNPQYDIVLESSPQWVCPVHGMVGEVVNFWSLRPGFPDVRHYCVLCVEDALRATGIEAILPVQEEEDVRYD